MAAKTSWHRFGTKLRHCHRITSSSVRIDLWLVRISVHFYSKQASFRPIRDGNSFEFTYSGGPAKSIYYQNRT